MNILESEPSRKIKKITKVRGAFYKPVWLNGGVSLYTTVVRL